MKSPLLVIIALLGTQALHAQVLPTPPVTDKVKVAEIAETDDEQENELKTAANLPNGVQDITQSVVPLNIRNYYAKDTLIIDNPRSEINRENIWKARGVPYDASMGVTAYSNTKGGKWQCTELAHRFFKTVYGVPTKIGLGMGHAQVMLKNLYDRLGSATYKYKGANVKMVYLKDGVAQEPPAVGSAVNFSIGKMGHVAIVRYVESIDEDTVKVYLLEQHGFPAWKPGQAHGVRSIVFTRSQDGSWVGARRLGAGKSISWINFKVL